MPLFLKKIDKIMDRIEVNCVGYGTIAIAVIMFINVVLRNILGRGLTWGNEISSYLSIFTVFFAVSAGFKHNSHIGVDAFVRVLPKKAQRPLEIISKVLSLIFCFSIAYLSARLVIVQSKQVSPVLKVPFSVLYGIMVVGMIMSSIRIIMEIIKIIKKIEVT